MVIGYSLLVIRYWLFVIGYSLLVQCPDPNRYPNPNRNRRVMKIGFLIGIRMGSERNRKKKVSNGKQDVTVREGVASDTRQAQERRQA